MHEQWMPQLRDMKIAQLWHSWLQAGALLDLWCVVPVGVCGHVSVVTTVPPPASRRALGALWGPLTNDTSLLAPDWLRYSFFRHRDRDT